jgi:hypothetical protein
MCIDHTHKSALNFGPRFLPRNFYVFAIALDEWFAQTIWVFVQLLECAALRTDEPMTKYIIAVSTNARDFVSFNGDLEPACCLA